MGIKTQYNYIGMDLSLASSAVYIHLKDGTEHYFNYRNSDKLTKWHKVVSYVNYRSYENIKIENNYSDTEIVKLLQYDKVTDMIVKDILSLCKPEETIIVTEGFSYSSNGTSLLDLVAYASLLRNKLLHMPFVDFIIKSPMTLKVETCKMTYPAIIKEIGGKNPRQEFIYKNKLGIAGGRFTKFEMVESMFDNEKIDIKLKKSLLLYKDDLLKAKMIPSPLSDLVDAMFLAYSEIII